MIACGEQKLCALIVSNKIVVQLLSLRNTCVCAKVDHEQCLRVSNSWVCVLSLRVTDI